LSGVILYICSSKNPEHIVSVWTLL
jgi:hypothetical protein